MPCTLIARHEPIYGFNFQRNRKWKENVPLKDNTRKKRRQFNFLLLKDMKIGLLLAGAFNVQESLVQALEKCFYD